jgi:hypothetical protein
MNNSRPIQLRDSRSETGRPQPVRKIAIALFALLIVLMMVVWLAFLGWGAIEMARSMLAGLNRLWNMLL